MTYYLSLGSNLGNREQTIEAALQQIEQQIGPIRSCSSYYYSEPWGFDSANAFCNQCCAVETNLSPEEVLRITQQIEKALGRTHKSTGRQYSDRTIDIDLIRCIDSEAEVVYHSEDLTLPHPLWEQRDFVKIPLAEIL